MSEPPKFCKVLRGLHKAGKWLIVFTAGWSLLEIVLDVASITPDETLADIYQLFSFSKSFLDIETGAQRIILAGIFLIAGIVFLRISRKEGKLYQKHGCDRYYKKGE